MVLVGLLGLTTAPKFLPHKVKALEATSDTTGKSCLTQNAPLRNTRDFMGDRVCLRYTLVSCFIWLHLAKVVVVGAEIFCEFVV